MKPIAFAISVGLTLVACSPREDSAARKQPLSIDKSEIDVSESDNYIELAPTRSRYFVLTNLVSRMDNEHWKRIKALSHRPVRITDGREVLATGEIAGVMAGKEGSKEVLHMKFDSPEALEALEGKLGFKKRQVLAEGCMENMKRIVTAARAWARSHNEALPPDFLAMKQELGLPAWLVCPSDMLGMSGKKVWEWSRLDTNHLTYQIVSPGASVKEPARVYLRCPIHGLAAYADGSVRKPDGK